MRKIIKSNSGASAVEFALVLPLLVLLLFGLIEFALIFYNQQVITNASREGARHAILSATPRNTLSGPPTPSITDVVTSYTNARLISFGTATVSVQLKDNLNCVAFGNPADGIQVQVSYPYTWLVLGRIMGFGTTINLTANTTMRCE